MTLAVVLANLGGPDRPQAVRPFLFNLFRDPAILRIPQPFRTAAAGLIAMRRAPAARAIYARLGGRSPILPETEAQARALAARLTVELPGQAISVVVAMRYWHPFVAEAMARVLEVRPSRLVLLPLYPQFSTTTTASFLRAWNQEAQRQGLNVPTAFVCCHPLIPSFVAAHASLLRGALDKIPDDRPVRVLFSAHGLPERIISTGDPYQWQVEQSAEAIVAALSPRDLDWTVCYQSRVGPLRWIGPSTDAEIRRAGQDGKGVAVVPLSFVSEHSETLVELDHDYARLAAEVGAVPYIRVPALRTTPGYMDALTQLVLRAAQDTGILSAEGDRLCPVNWAGCPNKRNRGPQDR